MKALSKKSTETREVVVSVQQQKLVWTKVLKKSNSFWISLFVTFEIVEPCARFFSSFPLKTVGVETAVLVGPYLALVLFISAPTEDLSEVALWPCDGCFEIVPFLILIPLEVELARSRVVGAFPRGTEGGLKC